MNDERNTGDGTVPATNGLLRVIGFPGTFTDRGFACVRHILESNGYAVLVTPLDHVPGDADDGAPTVRVLFGHGPIIAETGAVPSRTIVFLDTPARPFHELISSGFDAVDAARVLSATLAPLPLILAGDGVLLVRHAPGLESATVQSGIAHHISSLVAQMLEPAADCPQIYTALPEPRVVGQALALLRQAVTPLVNFVTGMGREPVVWPLACFYAGDFPDELASSFIEVVGPARILYYGPYFYLPRGRWRADIQLIVSGNMHDKKLAVDVYAGVALARHAFKPAQGGLLQASLIFVVERAEDRIEVRVELLEGAIEGYLGLKQVLLYPIET
jgi:hypothetical protein